MKTVCGECGREYTDDQSSRLRMTRRVNRIERQLLTNDAQKDPKKKFPEGKVAHMMEQHARLTAILNREDV